MPTYKKLLPYLLLNKRYFAGMIVFGIIMSVAQAYVARITGQLFDGLNNKDIQAAIVASLYIPALYFVHGIARYLHWFYLKMTAELLSTKLQRELQEKYMQMNLGYYSSSDTGGMISKTINDVSAIQFGVTIFADLAREPITALLLMGYILYLDWKLTVILLLVCPPVIFIISSLSRGVRKYSHQQQESMEDFTSTLKETVDGVRIIQSFNLMNEMRRRLSLVIDHYIAVRKKIIIRQESAGPLTEFLVSTVVALLFYYKGHDIINGTSTLGEFMAYFTALAIMTPSIKKIQDGIIRIQPTLASTERIFTVLAAKTIVPETVNPVTFPLDWKEIEFKNVSFSYGNSAVLKSISLKIKRGERLALVGESGSGKSTFVNLLERFYDPLEGEILIGGVSTRNISLHELREHIALVTQDVFLFNDSIERNIQSGNFGKQHYTVQESAQMANAHDFIARMQNGYETRAGDRGGRLSGGEKQRISIARAIYKNAPILILDEATSALDSASEVEVQKGLDKLMEGRTAFVIAHRFSTIVNADRILVFKHGEIIEQGTHQQLMEHKGTYYEFQQLQKI